MRTKRYTKEDIQYVNDNLGAIPLADMARHLQRSEKAVRQLIRRHRIQPEARVKRNLLLLLLSSRFRHLEDFTPSQAFFTETGITPRRFWSLYRGRNAIRGDEYVAVAKYFNITTREAMETRQLGLFDH